MTGRSQGHDGTADVIRSPSNRVIRYVRSLQRRATRQVERAFVVEGDRAIADALAAGATPRWILLKEGADHPDVPWGADIRVIVPDLFDDLCDTVHPQGILGVFPFPDLPIPDISTPFYLVADRVRDPGNLGTLLRSAAAAGVTAVFLTAESVDPYNPKVTRAGMGAHFRVPIADLTSEHMALLRAQTPLRALADLGDHPAHDALDWRQPVTLIVASETNGPSNLARALATVSITIPMAAGIESLNAGVAGSVVLFEAARQRRTESHLTDDSPPQVS